MGLVHRAMFHRNTCGKYRNLGCGGASYGYKTKKVLTNGTTATDIVALFLI